MSEITGQQRALEILLVEDNPADVRLTREVLRAGLINCSISVVEDGEAAIHFLRRIPPYHAAPKPHLVLLDLNLPRKDGREVLAEIKNDPELRMLPVVVLTSSAADLEVRTCYDLHANCFVVKPADFAGFSEALRTIQDFWMHLVRLPDAA